jgi:alpha-L-rhamnosidase
MQTVITDEAWEWSNDGPIRFADLKDGEWIDASKEPSYQGRAMTVSGPKGAMITASDNVPVREQERLEARLLPGNVLDSGRTLPDIWNSPYTEKKDRSSF